MKEEFPGREKYPGTIAPGQVNFTLGQVKMKVWWSGAQVRLASVVFLAIMSSQEQDVQNNDLKAWINVKSKHTLLAFVLCYSLSLGLDSTWYIK